MITSANQKYKKVAGCIEKFLMYIDYAQCRDKNVASSFKFHSNARPSLYVQLVRDSFAENGAISFFQPDI